VRQRQHRKITAVVLGAALVASTAVTAACSEDPDTSSPASSTVTTSDPGAEPSPTTTAELGPYVGPVGDLVGEALTNYVFTALAGYVLEAGLLDVLRSDGPFTVFAPTDEAFSKIPLDTLRAVQSDTELLTTVLTYHVVPGLLLSDDLQPGEYETAAGANLTIERDGDKVLVNGFEVVAVDVIASNGVIHVMGDVLLPPDA
jgi:transforming growth factor-beta-induced protein